MTDGLYLQTSTTHELKPLQFNVSPTWETSLQRRRDEFQKASDGGASVCGLLIQGLAPTDFPLDGLLREVRPNLPASLRQVEYLSAWDGPEMSRRTRKTSKGSVEFQAGLIQQVYLFGATGSDGRDKVPADRYTKTAELAGKCMHGTPAEVNRFVWRGHWAEGFYCPNFASYWTAAVFHLAWRNVPPLMAEQFAWQGLKSWQLALDDNHPRRFSVIENLFDASVEAVDVLLAAWEATPGTDKGKGGAGKTPAPRDATPKGKKKRGRKPDTDAKADKRVFDAWKTGSYGTYEDLGHELAKSKREIKLAIDRHRHRIRPRRKKNAL